MLVCIKQIMASKPSSAVVCLLQSIVYDQIEEKSSIGLTAATLKDFRSNYRMQQISAHICDR